MERHCAMVETVTFGSGLIMFWAGVSLNLEECTALVMMQGGTITSLWHIAAILHQHVTPFAGYVGNMHQGVLDKVRCQLCGKVSAKS